MARITRKDAADGAAGIGIGGLALVLIVLVLAGVSALLWALGVFTAAPRGAGNVYKDQQSASNREHWSQTFHGEYQQIQADRDNLATLKTAETAPDATQQDRINYTGAQLNCRTDVAQYNSDASSLLGGPWIPADLPSSIDATTYCGS